MSLLLLFVTSNVVAYTHRRIPLIAGNVYKLSFRVRSSLAQTFSVFIADSSSVNISLSASPSILADAWTVIAYEFTAAATDPNSYMQIKMSEASQDIYLDQFRLINLTKERKQYRIMRIQGSLLTGSFVQSLTLREVSAQETA